jgi:solute carrier family 25 (mitochondrial carrier protein), member 16
MPTGLMNHVSMSDAPQHQPRENTSDGAKMAGAKKAPPICPTDDETVTLRKQTRSLDYVWKSGVAGGFAGCAVSSSQGEGRLLEDARLILL